MADGLIDVYMRRKPLPRQASEALLEAESAAVAPSADRAAAVAAAAKAVRSAASAPRRVRTAGDVEKALYAALAEHGLDGACLVDLVEVLEAPNGGGKTALHLAAQLHPDAAVTELLLSLGARPNVFASRGHTPLIYAAGRGRWATVDALLKAGANAAVRCASGDTAADLANHKLSPTEAAMLRREEAAHATERGGFLDFTQNEEAMKRQAEHALTCPNCRPKLGLAEDEAALQRADQLAGDLLRAAEGGDNGYDGTLQAAEKLVAAATAVVGDAKAGRGAKGGSKVLFDSPCVVRTACSLALKAGDSEDMQVRLVHMLLRVARMDLLWQPKMAGVSPSRGIARYVVDAVARALRSPRAHSKRALLACGIAATIDVADTEVAADLLRSWPDADALRAPEEGGEDDAALGLLEERLLALAVSSRGRPASLSALARVVAWASSVEHRHWQRLVRRAAAMASASGKGRQLLCSLPKAVTNDARAVLEEAIARPDPRDELGLEALLQPATAVPSKQATPRDAGSARAQAAARLAALPQAAPVASFTWVGCAASAEAMVAAFENLTSSIGETLVAVDCEWHEDLPARASYGGAGDGRRPGAPALVQLAINGGASVYLVDTLIDVCAAAVLQALSVDCVTVLGFAFGEDLTRLRLLCDGAQTFAPRIVDLQQAVMAKGLRANGGGGPPGLQATCARVLGTRLCKAEQCSDWGARPLRKEQVEYAALDASILLDIWRGLNALRNDSVQ